MCVRVYVCARVVGVCGNLSYEGSELVTAYFTDATGGHGTSRHCRPKVQEHQSPYLNLLSRLANMSSVCVLPLASLVQFIYDSALLERGIHSTILP